MNIFSFFANSKKQFRQSKPTVLACVSALALTCPLVWHPTSSSFASGNVEQNQFVAQQDDFQKRTVRERLEKLAPEKQQQALAALEGVALDVIDENLRIDLSGDLYFVCPVDKEVLTEKKVAKTFAQNVFVNEETFALSALPIFHSRPGASKTIILDFDGHTVINTAWNSSTRPSIPALAYDTSGDANTFSNNELTAAANIWKRIAEDYAPFDVDVTTEEPVVLTTTTARVLITQSTDASGVANPSSTAGGVAYVNVFGNANFARFSPAWVYSNNLGGGREDLLAEAASHEAGHNLGLSHDATPTASYYGGHGTGEVSWAPLMGTGYFRNVSQWSKGEYPNANNTQDDLAIIAGKIGYRTDDYGDQTNNAGRLSISNNNVSTRGTISQTADVDVFSFATNGGNVNLRVQPFLAAGNTRGGNLDVKAELLNSSGTVLLANDSAAQTHVEITTNLVAGNYYLRVSGVGAGDLITGYSDYGSLGQYSITGTMVGGVNSGVAKFDFDGDRKADISVYRPESGIWYLSKSADGLSSVQFGASTDKVMAADYDGDGKTDLAVYRPSNGTWYLQRSIGGFAAVQFGASGDVPAPADYDGDGRAELAVFRPSNGTWYSLNLFNNQFSATQFGASTDKVVAADYDGDGRADIAVFRPSNGTWYSLRSTQGFTAVQFGASGDVPAPADYDGDGRADAAVFRAGTWYFLQSTEGFKATQFGAATDLPVAADYDGDERADTAVYRSGIWYYLKSGSGNQFASVQFGAATDNPIPAFITP